MAKKILAVVLAVMVALSAMAITAFADAEIRTIPLYPDKDHMNNTTNGTYEVSFDIPVYGLYGYLTAGDYMELTLPAWWGWNVNDDLVDWSLYLNGERYLMKAVSTTGTAPGTDKLSAVDTQNVVLAFLPHNYDGFNTAIPQINTYNTYTSIRLVATMTNSGAADSWRVDTGFLFTNNDAQYRNRAKAQWYKADGTPVNGSVSYIQDWNPTASSTSSIDNRTWDFITDEATNGTWDTAQANPLNWDHTIQARTDIMSAESAKLVVKLNKKINGQAVYTLYGSRGYANDYLYGTTNYWWQLDSSRKFIDQKTITDATDVLEFTVPMDYLLESKYGTMNSQFVIFENITLFNAGLMKINADGTVDYRHVDTAKAGTGDNGRYGRLSWGGDGILKYDGEPVNYARSGKAGVGHYATLSSDSKTFTGNADQTTSVTVKSGMSYKVSAVTTGSVVPNDIGFFVSWAGGNKAYKPASETSLTVTADDLVAMGYKLGDPIKLYCNNYAGGAYNTTVTVEELGYTGYQQGADVVATSMYLELTMPEVAEDEPEAVEPETPTQGTDTDDESEEVGDETPAVDAPADDEPAVDAPATVEPAPAPAEDNNPSTGIALAVIPMLLSAAAAVVSKKH